MKNKIVCFDVFLLPHGTIFSQTKFYLTRICLLALCLFPYAQNPLLAFANSRATGYGDTLYVFALSGLRLRGLDNGVVGLIPYGSQIIIEGYEPNARPDTIENIPGFWTKTTWKGTEGYVFNGFLSRLPAPDAAIKDIPTYAARYFTPDSSSRDKYHYKDWKIELTNLLRIRIRRVFSWGLYQFYIRGLETY